jgi:Protein kinase domain
MLAASMALSDRFELGRALGQGTFGTTFLGTERATGRAVAIKRLPLAGLPEWKPVELFEREARVLRSLDHPGVPAFVDAFEDDDPTNGHQFYIVSELIEGPTLQAEIARGRRWSPDQARALLEELLETLDYLHSLSPRVIHRDIKPGNVVLRSSGADDWSQPVLVDFGSVRDVAARQGSGGMTIAGTAGYMAPEQAMGIADVRSDLYGLGATMAHVLTHVHPSELPRTGLRPHLSDLAGADAELGRILERLLEPDPERRYASAAEVLRALGSGVMETAQLSVVPSDALSGTALARRDSVDTTAALARLSEGPRAVGPSVEARLDYLRAMRGALPLSLGIMVGGMAASVAFLAAKLVLVGMPLMFLSIIGFLLAPLTKRAQARRLYANGSVTRGRILQARSENGPLYIKYVFRHEERDYKGYLLTSDALIANRIGPDTPVFVFFDPKDPRRNAGLLPDELPDELCGRANE